LHLNTLGGQALLPLLILLCNYLFNLLLIHFGESELLLLLATSVGTQTDDPEDFGESAYSDPPDFGEAGVGEAGGPTLTGNTKMSSGSGSESAGKLGSFLISTLTSVLATGFGKAGTSTLARLRGANGEADVSTLLPFDFGCGLGSVGKLADLDLARGFKVHSA